MSFNPRLLPALLWTPVEDDLVSDAGECDPFLLLVAGRQGIGVVQPQSGINYPLVDVPSADVRYLFADMFFSYDDPADYDDTVTPFKPPFHVRWVHGLGCTVSSLPSWASSPTHDVDMIIADDDGWVVFDSTESSGFMSEAWGDRLHVYGWETDNGILRVVVHTAWPPANVKPLPFNYETNITPARAQIDERAVERRPKRVKSLTVILDNFTRTSVDWVEGFNVEITHIAEIVRGNRLVQQVGFDATPGNGLGLFPVCDEVPPVIGSINGVRPDDAGSFLISATGCYSARQPTDVVNLSPRLTQPEEATLQITNDCGPCCPCEDYVDTNDYMVRIRNIYKRIGREAEDVRDKYHENRDRWNEAKCCYEQRPLRLILQPQVCPYIDVAGQFCNMTDRCLTNFEMLFDFREDIVDEVVSLSSGVSESVGGSLSAGAPGYGVEEVPGFTFIRGAERTPGRRSGKLTRYDLGGTFPQLTAFWDSVEPYQTVWVRFRLRVSPLVDSGGGGSDSSLGSACPTDAVSVKVALTALSEGTHITVPNCGSIPSEPACAGPSQFPTIAKAEGVVVLNCPADASFFWDPYACPSKEC